MRCSCSWAASRKALRPSPVAGSFCYVLKMLSMDTCLATVAFAEAREYAWAAEPDPGESDKGEDDNPYTSEDLRRHKLPAPHLALWPTEVHVVVRRKVCEKGCYFGGIYPPRGGNRQNEGMYVKYMPLFLFLATHKFSK